ncbi:MAG: ATP-binding cassette domain-containing protein [Oscillospiraceae bacterium]
MRPRGRGAFHRAGPHRRSARPERQRQNDPHQARQRSAHPHERRNSDRRQSPSPETKAIVSYLPDRNALPDWMTVAQTVGYYADFYADFRRDAAQEMIQRLGLDVSQRVKTLSKGTREKLQLILVMSRAAKLYLLDEPIGGVDPATRDYILRTIIGNYNEDASVVISTHLIADVEQVLDEVIFLQNGRVERHTTVDAIRGETGKSVDELFREVFKC